MTPDAQDIENASALTEDHSAFVRQWRDKIMAAKRHHDNAFKRMKECREFAYYNAPKKWAMSGQYVVPFLRRQLKQIAAGLYARNPTAIAVRRKQIDAVLWNGDFAQLQQAFQTVTAAANGQPVAPEMLAIADGIVREAERVRAAYSMRDRFAKTLEIMFEYFLEETEPRFKAQMKQTVYRERIDGVAFLKLGLQRVFQPRPNASAAIEDDANQLAEFQRLQNASGDSASDDTTDRALLGFMGEAIGADDHKVLREGPVFDFPRSDKIIVDPACTLLKTFTGAEWIAEEMDLTAGEIKRIYGFDINSHPNENYRSEIAHFSGSENRTRKVWEVQHKTSRLVFTICESSDAFLKPPAAPDVKLERFWSVFAYTLDPVEMEGEIYPLSYVYLSMDGMNDLNVTRQARKDHVRANKPKYGVRKGVLDEALIDRLKHHEANEVFQFNLGPDQKLGDVITPFEPYGLDPNQYSDAHIFADAQRTAGMQAAAFATPRGVTATETSIAEESRESAESSDVDDLDDFLTEFAKALGEVLLAEVSLETVKSIAGPGAVWPSLSETEIFKGVTLAVRAGSSGRPNQAAMLAKLERAMPFLAQIPNINPTPIGKRYAETLDLSADELVVEGLPSINALNAAAGKPPVVSSVPGEQGPQGAANAPTAPAAQGSVTEQNPAQALAPGETAGLR